MFIGQRVNWHNDEPRLFIIDDQTYSDGEGE